MVEIKIIIPNNKLDEFKLGFLKVYPKPNGLSDMQHIKAFIRKQLINQYKTGKIMIARETTSPLLDETVVEV